MMNPRKSGPLPNDLGALYAETQGRTQRYDFTGAVEVLQHALKLAPDNEKIMVELGTIHAKAYDFASARRWFDEAVVHSKGSPHALNAIAQGWMDVRQFDEARKVYAQVLAKREIPLITLVRLADIATRQRRLEEAAQCIEQAGRLYGGHEAVHLAKAKLARQMGQHDDAETQLRVMLFKAGGEPGVKAAGWYELGLILDAKGQYDQAMTAILEAKKLMRQGAGQPLSILRGKQGHMKQMAETASAKNVQRWRAYAASELQPARKMALLGGHARSGTTLLEYVIAAHPQVALVEETQIYHNHAYYPLGLAISSNSTFVAALDWITARTMRQIRSAYFAGAESFLGAPLGDRMLLDKNPANTFDIPSLVRIFPENKFVISLRDPRDVCLSCFMQAVNLLPDTAAWLTLKDTIHHFGLIMGLWSAWKPYLGDVAIEVRYEDVVGDLEGTARRTLQFLGLEWDDRALRPHEHASSTTVLSPTFAEVTKPVYRSSVGRWQHYQKYFDPCAKELEPILKSLGYA